MSVYCIFSSHYLPYLGGVERYTYNLATTLKRKGHEVIIVTSHMEGQPGREVRDGIEIIRTDCFSIMKDRLPFYRFNRNNAQVLKYLLERKVDRIVINTKFYLLSYVAARFAGKNDIPAIVIEHGTGHIDFSSSIVRKIGEIYEHILTAWVYRNCRNFVGVSDDCGKWLEHFGVKAIGTMYNSIDYDEIQDILKDNVPDREEGFVVAYSGRIMREKGVCDLAHSYSVLKKDYPQLKLVMMGSGPEYDQLREEFRDDSDVSFTGRLDYKDVIKKLAGADVFCFPSLYPEGLPTCILEAMAVGLYVVATPQGGTKEVICDDKYGVVLYDYSNDKLTEALKRALDMDEKERLLIAAAGRERVKNDFTWDRTVAEMEKIYGDLKV